LIHRLALIGTSLKHSFSKSYFDKLFNTLEDVNSSYSLIELQDIHNWKKESLALYQLTGFNVTIPFKMDIFSLCDQWTNEALATRSVNTVKIVEGKWLGENTDVKGFEFSLNSFIPQNFNSQALILGNGGAAQAVKFVLDKKGIPYHIITRNRLNNEFNEEELKIYAQKCHLIINATPLGMFPNEKQEIRFPYHLLNEKHFLFDMVYNPSKTLFLYQGEKHNSRIKNGYEMLIKQAEASWKYWNSEYL